MRRIFVSALLLLATATAAHANCYNATLQEPQPFLGNGGEVIVLSDGSVWKNTSYLYLYLYAYSPMVTICPGDSQMILNGTAFNIVRLQ